MAGTQKTSWVETNNSPPNGVGGGGLNFHQVELNKPLTKVSRGLLTRGVEMVHIADSYESFQLVKFKLCTMH